LREILKLTRSGGEFEDGHPALANSGIMVGGRKARHVRLACLSAGFERAIVGRVITLNQAARNKRELAEARR
jgi:hypothetical protein